jgi:nucleoid-associated protein YgaU
MPNDAKLGLVVGVGLVIAVGVVFYRKDAQTGNPAAIDKSPAVQPAADPTPKPETVAKATSARRHTFQAGETLTGLARQYLGDEAKVAAIRALNPGLQGQDDPPAGTVLVIPDAETGNP